MPDSFSGQSITCFRGERFVFEGLDFTLSAGGALVLTGPNGSGKSSLMRIMAGLLQPADGQLLRDGEPISAAIEDHRERLHYVGYQDAIKSVMTVRENLSFWAGLKGGRGRVDDALDALGIARLADTPGQFLSSGQRRRLSLARLLASPAPLWLLDEPTVGLDREAVSIIEGIVAAHRAGGGMTVLATHLDIGLGDRPEKLNLADYVARRQIFDAGAAG
jgi:heme exporter protein A